MTRALFDVLLFLLLAYWLDYRLARIEYWLTPEEEPIARVPDREDEELARVEPPELKAQCPATRGAMRCTMEEGHQGAHSGRAGVSWGAS